MTPDFQQRDNHRKSLLPINNSRILIREAETQTDPKSSLKKDVYFKKAKPKHLPNFYSESFTLPPVKSKAYKPTYLPETALAKPITKRLEPIQPSSTPTNMVPTMKPNFIGRIMAPAIQREPVFVYTQPFGFKPKVNVYSKSVKNRNYVESSASKNEVKHSYIQLVQPVEYHYIPNSINFRNEKQHVNKYLEKYFFFNFMFNYILYQMKDSHFIGTLTTLVIKRRNSTMNHLFSTAIFIGHDNEPIFFHF
jgi:hypothetical protein